MISPFYKASSSNSYDSVKKLAKKYDVSFYDFYADEEMSHDKSLFSDPSHLNDRGARFFTEKVAVILKDLLCD